MYSELQDSSFDNKGGISLSLTGEHNRYAARLWEWLLKVVKENETLVCSDVCSKENQLLSEVSEGMNFVIIRIPILYAWFH